MIITERELRLIVRETLQEGKFADLARSVGKHGSKLMTRPAGIIAKVMGRLSTSKDSSGYEKRIDMNVKGLEKLVGDLMHLPGRGLEMGYNAFEKLMHKVMPDLDPEQIEGLHKEIDSEKRKMSRSGNQIPAGSQLAAEARIRKLAKL